MTAVLMRVDGLGDGRLQPDHVDAEACVDFVNFRELKQSDTLNFC